MSFPKMILGIPIGWQDRGESERNYTKSSVHRIICSYCYSIVHVGREKDEKFLFCPKCLAKVKLPNTEA